ncbi:MAG: hypothetical protein R3F20_07380 [Planctomycetota bacterium]
MKNLLAIVGMLTLALWVFVGLLHGFLVIQGKNSPETYAKLHAIPVVGGYFPAVEIPSEEQVEKAEEDAIRLDIVKARTDFKLPPGWTAEQLEELIADVKSQRESLVKDRETVEAEREATVALIEELDAREQNVNAMQVKLDALAQTLSKRQDELDVQLRSWEVERDEKIDANLKRMSKVVAGMKPDLARNLLIGESESLPEDERAERYADAARLLSFLSPEASSAIMERMTPVEYQRILEVMKAMPPTSKNG